MKRVKCYALVDSLFVNLEDVNGHATSSGELPMAKVALEVFGFLVLNQYLLIIKFPITVIAPNLI